jgi:hypothetical protein
LKWKSFLNDEGSLKRLQRKAGNSSKKKESYVAQRSFRITNYKTTIKMLAVPKAANVPISK